MTGIIVYLGPEPDDSQATAEKPSTRGKPAAELPASCFSMHTKQRWLELRDIDSHGRLIAPEQQCVANALKLSASPIPIWHAYYR
eukprot:6189660-Pleurochrysis_carterae.AAC.1